MISPQDLVSMHESNKQKRIHLLEEKVDRAIKDFSNRPSITNKFEIHLGTDVPIDEVMVVLSEYRKAGWKVEQDVRIKDSDGVISNRGNIFLLFEIPTEQTQESGEMT